MKLKTFYYLIFFLVLTILLNFAFFKPALAMAPPPASHAWLWHWLRSRPASTRLVTVKVTWPEGAREEKIELKAILKNIR